MSFLPVYLDSSAIVKLVSVERETDALLDALNQWPDRVSSALAGVEVHRALRRMRASQELEARAEAVLSSVVLLRLDEVVLIRAASLKSPELRALDAIHLAAALTLGDDPEAFVTYDARLARAAERERLRIVHPGSDLLTDVMRQ